MNEILKLNIKELADKYRKRKISPLEVIKENYKKIDKREKELNMFIDLYEEEAIETAKIAEQKFITGNYEKDNLLLGIPYGIKDLYGIKDKEMTCGSPSMSGYVSKTNSAIYNNITNNGGILLGKTNMNEFAAGYVNEFYGRTNNPINPQYTAGGSSGGSAALIGDGIGLFAFGTDTGGSIRIPGSYCGIIGLKPTKGFLSEKGILPLSKTLDHPGYFTRNLEDLIIVLSSLKKTEIKEMINLDRDIYKDLRIGILSDKDLNNIDEDIREEYERLITNIKKKKTFYMKEILLPDNKYVLDTFEKIFFPEMSYIHENLKTDKNLYRKETFDMIKKGNTTKALDYIKGLDQKDDLSRYFEDIFKEIDVLVTPTLGMRVPVSEETSDFSLEKEMKFTLPFNISGNPAVTINMGRDKNNMPVGIQFIGKRNKDFDLIQHIYCIINK